MFKKSLSLLFCLASLQIAKAASADTLTIFLKNSGRTVKSKDSADYYRIVLPPDSSIDKDLYRVFEYYPNGKLKTAATSFTKSNDLVLDGTCIEYFMNGRRKKATTFKNGRYNGIQTTYYPNGKLYQIMNIKDQGYSYYLGPRDEYKTEAVEVRDSTGKILVSNGTGHIILFDDDFKKIIEEGDIKNSKKEGEWRGEIADSGKFICTFHKGEFKSGVSYMKSGHHYEFKQIYQRPAFGDWPGAFDNFIKKHLKYPESARKYKMTGSVVVQFYIEPDGTLSEVKVDQGILKSLDEEAVRVISLSPPWYPATQFGAPFRTHQTISVSFFQAYYTYSH